MLARLCLVVTLASACSYGPTFRDCEIRCSAATGCPDGFACLGEGLCRSENLATSCADILSDAGAGDGSGSGSGFVGDHLTYLKSSNSDLLDRFGQALAMSADGTTLAVGGPLEDSNSTIVGGNQNDNSVANSGAVYIFTRAGSTWVQQAYIKPSNTGDADQFGTAVALSTDGNTLAVGAVQEDSGSTNPADNTAQDAGAAYVFVRSGITWSQQAYVKPSNIGAADGFGFSVALSGDGDTLAVGAVGEDSGDPANQADNSATSAGAVYVFVRVGVQWTQQAYVKADLPIPAASFGVSLALSTDGTTLAVGASTDKVATIASAGRIYVFRRSGTTWPREVVLSASTPGNDDELGSSVALSADGNTLAAGAPFEDSAVKNINGDETNNAATDSGATYVFRRSGTSWSEEAYVKASNTDAGDLFGTSVALSADGSTLAIGAPAEASAAKLISGDQNDNSITNAGAAYVLVRSGTTWSHHAYVKAGNPGTNDQFGTSVGLSGDATVGAFGALGEDSTARGIDGDQTASGAASSGAVYAFF